MSITSELSSIDRGKISYRTRMIASARNFDLAETKEIVKVIIQIDLANVTIVLSFLTI